MATIINADTVTGGAVITGDGSGQLALQAAGVTKLTVASTGVTLASALPIASGGTGSTSTTFVNLTTNVTATLPVANGGTGAATLTGVIKGNGTSAITAATAGTDYVAPGGALGTPSSGTLTNCTADGTNSIGYRNIPQVGVEKVASYTLAAADVGKFVSLGTSGTIVIPASVFAVGSAISIFNNTAATIACTCSAITTVYKGGTNTNISATGFSITTRGVCTILFITTTLVVITGNLV